MLKPINIIRIMMLLIIVVVSSVFLPDLYWKANKREMNKTNVFYSPIKKCFLLMKSDVRGVTYTDTKGKEFTRDEFEALVPFMNFRQLTLSGKLPDSIDGVKMIPHEININNVTLRVNPAMINYKPLQIFPLFESESGRVRLELSPDYFRISSRMEFVTSQQNEINEEKSVLFTNALQKEEFKFPAKGIYGNPSTKKPFDQGYFVLDSDNKVFHIKMVKGKPFCKNTGIPSELGIVFMAINEVELREFYGLIITDKNEAYLLSYDNYKLIKLPLDRYNYEESSLQIKGDLFYRVLVVNRENGYNVVVTDRNYKVIDKLSETNPGREESIAGITANYIFPFTMVIEKDSTPFIGFYIKISGAGFLILSSILSLLTAVYFHRKQLLTKLAPVYCLLVLLTGIYGFIAVLAIKDFDDDPGDTL